MTWCVGANDILLLAILRSISMSSFRIPGHWPPEEPLHVALLDIGKAEGELPTVEWLFQPRFLQHTADNDDLLIWRLAYSWIVVPATQQCLPQRTDLEDRWLNRLVETEQPPENPQQRNSLPAVALADLALDVELVENEDDRAAANEAFRQLVKRVRALVRPRRIDHVLLESWSWLQGIVRRLLDFSEEEDIEPEHRHRMTPRLSAQYRALSNLQFHYSHAEQDDAPPKVPCATGETDSAEETIFL